MSVAKDPGSRCMQSEPELKPEQDIPVAKREIYMDTSSKLAMLASSRSPMLTTLAAELPGIEFPKPCQFPFEPCTEAERRTSG